MTPIAQLNDNSVTASMDRIRALFDKYLPDGRLVGAVARISKAKPPKKRYLRLGPDTVKAIRNDLVDGMAVCAICKKYGVKDNTVYRIKNKRGRFA